MNMLKRSHGFDQSNIPQIEDDFLKICTYEYIYPQQKDKIAKGEKVFSDNPQTLATYPVVNSTINHFIRLLSMQSVDHYREHVGERLDNLIAQTFMDFFSGLGERHTKDNDIYNATEELDSTKTKPELFSLAFDDYVATVGADAKQEFSLFIQIYERNLEKMLEVAQVEDRTLLLEQIDAVHELTKGKLKPNVVMPGSKAAIAIARNENHTFENTKWKR